MTSSFTRPTDGMPRCVYDVTRTSTGEQLFSLQVLFKIIIFKLRHLLRNIEGAKMAGEAVDHGTLNGS